MGGAQVPAYILRAGGGKKKSCGVSPPARYCCVQSRQGDNIGTMQPPHRQMCVNKAAAPGANKVTYWLQQDEKTSRGLAAVQPHLAPAARRLPEFLPLPEQRNGVEKSRYNPPHTSLQTKAPAAHTPPASLHPGGWGVAPAPRCRMGCRAWKFSTQHVPCGAAGGARTPPAGCLIPWGKPPGKASEVWGFLQIFPARQAEQRVPPTSPPSLACPDHGAYNSLCFNIIKRARCRL